VTTAEKPSLTFVLPVYNGARFFGASLATVWAWLATEPRETELLVVDDGSSDATWALLQQFAAEHPPAEGQPRFVALRNAQNRGKGYSLRRAFLEASGELVVFTDADLTYPVENVASLVATLEQGPDLAYGSRMHADSRYIVAPTFFPLLFTRHAMGRVFNFLVQIVVVSGIRDTQAGLKGFRRAAARALAERIRLDRFSFDVEMFFVARRLGQRIAECPVTFLYRKEPSTVRFARDSLRMLRDMLVIRWRGWRGVYDGAPDPALLADLRGEPGARTTTGAG
jgi:dolichyl-phosphate beta-glucosyltransferase